MQDMNFLRVAAALAQEKIADPSYNGQKIKELWKTLEDEKADLILFPELALPSYSAADLFLQEELYLSSLEALNDLLLFSKKMHSLAIISTYIRYEDKQLIVAALLYRGQILAFIPKTYLAKDSFFQEERFFISADDLPKDASISLFGQDIPLGHFIIQDKAQSFSFGLEIGSDLWAPLPPSSFLYLQGADLIFNPAALPAGIAKKDYLHELIKQQSARFNGAYIFASAGPGQSTTDYVMSGSCLIAENGNILAGNSSLQRESAYVIADIDLDILASQRRNNSHLVRSQKETRKIKDFPTIRVSFDFQKKKNLKRKVNPSPFVTDDKKEMDKRCQLAKEILTHGLAKRLQATGIKKLILGLSGGLDSSLALLLSLETLALLGLPAENLIGVTMPGFGTSPITLNNSRKLGKELGITFKEIDIKNICLEHFKLIGHDPEKYDLTYENVQARQRTELLMNLANKEGALLVGSGSISELALGWATYNGDHMSMYALNSNLPKTMARSLLEWMAEQGSEKLSLILKEILNTPVSPELLPLDSKGEIQQKTEDSLGPYQVHDFFLYNFLKYGYRPEKLLFLAKEAFKGTYSEENLLIWLKTFLRRFFSQQFKRSCMPDGPSLGSISLSSRGGLKMPSDAHAHIWLEKLN
jgi:NAD+ synthase (glutamine-hydrolysing)